MSIFIVSKYNFFNIFLKYQEVLQPPEPYHKYAPVFNTCTVSYNIFTFTQLPPTLPCIVFVHSNSPTDYAMDMFQRSSIVILNGHQLIVEMISTRNEIVEMIARIYFLCCIGNKFIYIKNHFNCD